jgi:NADH:ubiquinone oxidoreductase subunit 6 (subunit J)
MELIHVVFWAFALLTCGSALMVALSPRLIHSVFALFFCFFGTAGLYVLMGADFLAAAQVIVYIGGILVLLIFGVMLTNKVETDKHLPNEMRHWVAAGGVCILTVYLLLSFPRSWARIDPTWSRTMDDAVQHVPARWAKQAPASPLPAASPAPTEVAAAPTGKRHGTEKVPLVHNTTHQIGQALLTTYLIPFELASLVLLIAMLGAASIARKEIR